MIMNQVLPLVTVLMPCKEVKSSFFREALNSVFSQSIPQWNLIIVYDRSKSIDTLKIIKQLSTAKDKRITVLINQSKLITGALNTGMKHAKTRYVCSLLCDDLLHNKAIEVLNRYIVEYPEIDFFHSSRTYIDGNGKSISNIHSAIESFNLSDFKNTGPVKHLLCWKVDSALSIGGMDETLGLHGADDYDFTWCMAEAGCKFKAIQECLYYYRDHREHYRLTTHVPLETQINELKKIWKKHGLTDKEISEQINRRTLGYLNQALFLDGEDKKRKEGMNYDIRKGWRMKYL